MKKIFTLIALTATLIQAKAQAPVGATMQNPINVGVIQENQIITQIQSNDVWNHYGNDYVGADNQYSDDIFYKFTSPGFYRLDVLTCNSNFDTYIHVLDANGNLIDANDDACGLAQLRSSLMHNIYAGDYYIVVEGFMGAHGQIKLQFALGQAFIYRPEDPFRLANPNLSNETESNKPKYLQVISYPNPVQNEFNLENLNSNFTNIEVIDISGRIVLTENIQDYYSYTLNTSNFENGLYLVRISGNSATETFKMQVSK